MSAIGKFRRFQTVKGAQIFRLPLEVFPGFWGYAYLVLVDELQVLIDAGSGVGVSNEHLESGLRKVGQQVGENIALNSLTHILITHGHIDHFGGLAYIRSRTQARIGVHELDRRNLTNYEQRLAVIYRRLKNFFVEAGVSEALQSSLLDMYMFTKDLYQSVNIDFTYEAEGMRVGPFELLHVPGHCAGHVVIRLDDVLFGGDHVLSDISPHQSPERLTLNTGLHHYLQSLDILQAWAPEHCLVLSGHEQPITNLPARLDAIRSVHRERLAQVLNLLENPLTVSEVSKDLFGEVSGYNILLALEEAGAHVEYLYQRGLIEVANIEELMNGSGPVPLRYQRVAVFPITL